MGEVGRLYGHCNCSVDTPFMSFLVGLLVSMLGLVNKMEGKSATGDGEMAC